MKNRTNYILLLFAFTLASVPAFASERWETLQAINWVENPRNSTKAGPRGELGPYQFRLSTWRMHTRKPFAWAVEREHADDVAIKLYEWIRRGLLNAGVPATTFNIALAWNAGLDAVINGRAPAAAHGYAEQVNNLAAHLHAQQVASAR
ncbi:MAG: hypothetical protein A3G75_15995 [Verrucomicrobia bacterium RIFCSPLOWO2_12_FULL_64_8]|nr:MAG: hypothetical protein A3G75_15995 [Verrucomicrobia bacterium RIFCSPLOWO2_12_FULL_64_8]